LKLTTSQWLVAGGDGRIVPDPVTGRNQYGCTVQPDADLIALGSSTASVISAAAWDEVSQLPDEVSDEQAWDDMRQQLRNLVGVSDDVDVVFAASGTDAHHIVAQYVRKVNQQPLATIMVAPEETGSGVAAAVAQSGLLTTIALREHNGCPRDSALIDADVEEAALAAITLQQHVLINLIDVSKTGMIAPSPACVASLQARYPEQITVLVDASQFRLTPATLQSYLQKSYVVVVTGSKFITGPCFSGAIFIPQLVTQNWQRFPVPASLQAVSYPLDWSRGFDVGELSLPPSNHGLYLRWRAALYEMHAFDKLDSSEVQQFFNEFSVAILNMLSKHQVFELLPVPKLQRERQAWDSEQTILSFVLYRDGQPLTQAQSIAIYRQLSATNSNRQRFQLGQPVPCGLRNGVAVSALRISASARLAVAALAPGGLGRDAVIAWAILALDEVVELVNKS
jgi:selenocysteine lyase/cysteine desulfurase